MLTKYYHDLNLSLGAGLEDIKSAYRRLAKENHPDAGGAHQPDKVSKFLRINEAYSQLLREEKKRSYGQESTSLLNRYPREPRAAKPKVSTLNYRREHDLYLNHSDLKAGFRVIFSINTNDVCPCCFGQGKTLLKTGPSPLLKSETCPKCHGLGTIEKKTELALILTDDMLAAGKVRLKKAGDYYPEPGVRGDIIINLKYSN